MSTAGQAGIRLSIRMKLVGLVIFQVLVLLGFGIMTYMTMQAGRSEDLKVLERQGDIQALITMQYWAKEQYLYQADLIINGTKESIAGFDAAAEQMDIFRDQVISALDTPEEIALMKQLKDADEAFDRTFYDEIIPAWEKNDAKLLKELDDRSDVYLQQMDAAVVSLKTKFQDEIEAAVLTTEENSKASQLLTGGVVLALSALSLWMGLTMANSIVRPVKKLAADSSLIAEGAVDKVMLSQSYSNDEIGDMRRSFDELVRNTLEMSETATSLSAGDLTVEVKPRSRDDRLGNALANLVSSLRAQVGQLAESVTAINLASSQLAASSQQAGQATGQIAATIQQVASGISQQTQSITQTAGSIEQMTRAIDGIARGAQEQSRAVNQAAALTGTIHQSVQEVARAADAVLTQSNGAAQAAAEGKESVQTTLEGMELIRTRVRESAEKVTEMGKRSDQIGIIVETIEDIASQTNLLALNAAIEAARAGEHGKGFAVVADEVRKLAERASTSTKEIAVLVNGIQKTVSEAVTTMDAGGKEVERGVTLAEGAGKTLQRILAATEAVNRQAKLAAETAGAMSRAAEELVNATDTVSAVVEENTASTEEMAAGSSEVTRAIENIASISEENSAAVEEVSASTEEMSAQVEEVSASAEALAEMARKLEAVVAQFKLGNQHQTTRPAGEPNGKKNGKPKGEKVEMGIHHN